MRKPRDIDAELRALQDKARGLKAEKITRLGELVVATGADALDPETLAGVLLKAVERTKADDAAKEAWHRRGEEFFRAKGRARRTRNGQDGPAPGEAPARAEGDHGGGAPDHGGAGQG